MGTSVILFTLLSWIAVHSLKQLPSFMTLHAPYTPFNDDSTYSLNVSVVPNLARNAANFGVNTVWVGMLSIINIIFFAYPIHYIL